jgi:hypothetical protein
MCPMHSQEFIPFLSLRVRAHFSALFTLHVIQDNYCSPALSVASTPPRAKICCLFLLGAD